MAGIKKQEIAEMLGVKLENEETKDTKPEETKDTKPEETKDTKPEETKDTKPEETKDTKPEETKDTKPVLPEEYDGLDLDNVLDEKPEPAPEEHVAEPPADTKEGKAFAAMRKEIKDLRDQLAAQTAQPVDNSEIEALRKQLQDKDVEMQKLMDQIGQLDLERDPRFNKKYQQAIEVVESQIKNTAKDLDVSDEVIAEALKLPLKQRLAYLQEEAGASAPLLLTLFAQRDALFVQKQAELSRHKEVRQQLEQEASTKDLAMEQQARSRLFNSALAKVRESGHFVFQDVPGNEARTKLSQKVVSIAKNLFDSSDGQRQSEAMMMGVAAPIYLHMLQVERAKRLEAEQKLANRYGKRGTLGSAAGGPEPGDSTKFKPMTAEEAAAALVARGPSGM